MLHCLRPSILLSNVHRGPEIREKSPVQLVTMVLISPDCSLHTAVQDAVSKVQGLKLEFVNCHDEATQRVARKDVALVLSHLNPSSNVAGLTRLLGTIVATGQKVPVVILS